MTVILITHIELSIDFKPMKQAPDSLIFLPPHQKIGGILFTGVHLSVFLSAHLSVWNLTKKLLHFPDTPKLI